MSLYEDVYYKKQTQHRLHVITHDFTELIIAAYNTFRNIFLHSNYIMYW